MKLEFLDCRPLNIREKEEAMQRVNFEHLFLCDHPQKSIWSVVSEEEKLHYVFFPMFLKFFVAAISKHSHEKIYDRVC